MTQKKPRKTRVATKPSAAGRAPGSAPEQDDAGERINRYLAGCGLCSRREADRWVEAGRISINRKLCREPGTKIHNGDIVAVDGKVVERQQSHTYILYNKPAGQLCSRKDDKRKRPLIYDFLDVAPMCNRLAASTWIPKVY